MSIFAVSDKAQANLLSEFFMSLLLRGQFSYSQIWKCLLKAKKVLDIEKEKAYRELYQTEYIN